MKTKSKYTYLILIVILSLVYWQWFLPGPKVATDFPLISQNYLKSLMDFPMTWTQRGGEGFGEYSIFSLWSYPASLIMGGLANLGLGFSVLERLFFMIPFLISGTFSIWKFLGIFKFSKEAKFLSSIFYLANTYIILLIDGGQLLIVLAYAFFPLSFLAIEKAISQNMHQKILAGLAVVLLGFLDIRFVFVLLLLSFLRLLYGFIYRDDKGRINWIKQWVGLGLITSVMLLGFNAFWLIPYFSFPPNQESFARLTQMANTATANIGHSILMISPHWYKNIFGEISPLRAEFILIPALAFLAPLVKKRNYFVGFWLLVALVSIFLSKGSAEPFSKAYAFLFSNVPGFSLFRDSTKFFFLVALSYTFLIGVTLEWLFGRFKSFKFKTVVSLVFLAYLLLLIRPVLLNQMTGTLSAQKEVEQFREIAAVLEEDKSFSRSFWIPSTLPLSYSTPIHPIVEALRMTEKRPFASGIKGTYELFNYLREAPYMGQLFDVSGIGYIVYPSTPLTKENLHPDDIRYYQTFWDQISNLPWVSKAFESGAPVLKVNRHREKFFLTSHIWWVIGSDSIYNEATKSSKLTLSNNALIFPEEKAGLGNRIEELTSATVVLFNKTLTDLAASFIQGSDIIFPAKFLSKDPDSSGWWKREGKDLIHWRYFLKTKYGIETQDFDLGGGWAVGEESLKLKVKSEKFKKGEVLLGRVMESSKSGSLSFYQGEDLVGTVNTKAEETNVRWFEVGVLTKDANDVVIESDGAFNVVNALTTLPREKWDSYLKRAQSLEKRIKTYTPENAKEGSAKVSYKEINPTKYIIEISGLKEDGLVVFSSSYDDFWNLDNNPSLPVYSMLNGFKVEKDGTYEVFFEPQGKVIPGIALSALFLIITLGYLILRRKQKK